MKYAEARTALVSRRRHCDFGAGSGTRCRFLRLLLAAHPEGMVAGEVQKSWAYASTLSHHVRSSSKVGLVKVRREGTNFLWYRSGRQIALREVLEFLYEECLHERGQWLPRRWYEFAVKSSENGHERSGTFKKGAAAEVWRGGGNR